MGTRVAQLRAIVTAETTQAEAGLRRFNAQIEGVGQLAGGVFDGLGAGLQQFAGPAGIGLAIAGAAKLAWSLEQMREESNQLEARFVGFAGGVGQAEAALRAMDGALGNALTRDEKMAAATKLLGLGIADTAGEAATLTRQALVLGIELETLTQALETGRATGLVQYGISLSDMRTRALELQAATIGLTDVEARSIAIQEQLAEKSAAVEAAGGEAATAVERLKNAWETLADTAADQVVLEVVINRGEEILTGATDLLAGPSDAELVAAQVGAEAERAAMAARNLADAQGALNSARISGHAALIAETQALYDAALAEDRAAQAALAAKSATIEAALAAANSVPSMNFASLAAGDYATAMLTLAEAQAQAARTTTGTFTTPSKTRWGLYGDWAQHQQSTGVDPVQQWLERQTAANKTAATDFKRAYGSAVDGVADRFQSEMAAAQQASIGLLDLRPGGAGGPNAPGANGAFEDIFRLQGFVADGSWGDVAARAGLDQAGAADVVRKFQSGIWDASVMQFVDREQLAQQIEQAQLGQAMMDALAADLAKSSQSDPKLVRAMLGMGAGSDGAAVTGLDMSGFVPGFLAGVDREIDAQETEIARRGARLWDVLGESFVARAGESMTFRNAVGALVEQALVEGLS